METYHNRFYKNRLVNILLLLSSFAIALGCFRIYFTGHLKGFFLVWNLFLAWIPFVIAFILGYNKKKAHPVKLIVFIPLWLLFLPNAPYIITDLIHLRPRDGVPLWYDATVLFLFAFDGLLLGIMSTLFIHEVIEKYVSSVKVWFFLSVCFVLSGYGIYLGRFLRWNSWDIVVNPVELLQESYLKITSPLAIGVTGIFSFFLFFSYLIFYQLIHLKNNTHGTKDS